MATDPVCTEAQSQPSPPGNGVSGIYKLKPKRHRPRGSNLSSFLGSPLKTTKRIWRRTFTSQRPIIEHTSMLSIPILWHLTIILIGIVIIALNLRGCFIGFKFAATQHERTQTLSMLALQVCAKVIVRASEQDRWIAPANSRRSSSL